MKSRKHIIITKLFEFGGSNTHLETLIEYFGKENTVLYIEEEEQLKWLKNVKNTNGLQIKTAPRLHKFAHLVYPSFLSNLKEAFFIIKSIFTAMLLGIKYAADITICSVEPEKYLYLLWTPFIRVVYILHTTPSNKFTPFTSYTCNTRLGDNKHIITVSNANKNEVCAKWDIIPARQQLVKVVYNCLLNNDESFRPVRKVKGDIRNVLTMGHVIEYKNPHLWLTVARQVTEAQPCVHFTWLGNGSLLEYFNNATRDEERINFVGFKTNTGDYLANATLYYQPSIHETHGIAVVEAMCHSLPCVVANIGGLPESVQDNYNGLLADPRDIEANVKAIINLVNDNTQLEVFGANAYKRYCKLFTFEHFKLSMDAIYAN